MFFIKKIVFQRYFKGIARGMTFLNRAHDNGQRARPYSKDRNKEPLRMGYKKRQFVFRNNLGYEAFA
jgi:hypothetical protein